LNEKNRLTPNPKLKLWAPKVRPERIWQLYQNDARGTIDEVLVHDVGIALYQRCESLLLVTSGRVTCPTCGTIFQTSWLGGRPEAVNQCPSCQWTITNGQYHATWRHQDLRAGNAEVAFRSYVEAYPRARSSRERTLLIDQLIHAFHIDLKSRAPNRSAANNLIEGSHARVVAMLDRLADDARGAPDRSDATSTWLATTEAMWKRRSGSSEAPRSTRPAVRKSGLGSGDQSPR